MDKDIVADYGNLYRAYKEAKQWMSKGQKSLRNIVQSMMENIMQSASADA